MILKNVLKFIFLFKNIFIIHINVIHILAKIPSTCHNYFQVQLRKVEPPTFPIFTGH